MYWIKIHKISNHLRDLFYIMKKVKKRIMKTLIYQIIFFKEKKKEKKMEIFFIKLWSNQSFDNKYNYYYFVSHIIFTIYWSLWGFWCYKKNFFQEIFVKKKLKLLIIYI